MASEDRADSLQMAALGKRLGRLSAAQEIEIWEEAPIRKIRGMSFVTSG